jgi:hypothetical protein
MGFRNCGIRSNYGALIPLANGQRLDVHTSPRIECRSKMSIPDEYAQALAGRDEKEFRNAFVRVVHKTGGFWITDNILTMVEEGSKRNHRAGQQRGDFRKPTLCGCMTSMVRGFTWLTYIPVNSGYHDAR